MNKYRIVSDGIRYRVQVYGKRWYTTRRWRFCGIMHPDCGWMVRSYNTEAEAEKAMAYAKKEDEAELQGYQPI